MSQSFVTLDEVLALSGGDSNESFENGNDFATKKFLLSFENIDASLLDKYNENAFVVEDDIVFNEPDTPADEFVITLKTSDATQGTVGFTSAGGQTQVSKTSVIGDFVDIYAVAKPGYRFLFWEISEDMSGEDIEFGVEYVSHVVVPIDRPRICIAYFTDDDEAAEDDDAAEEEEEEEAVGGSLEEEAGDEGIEEND